MIEVRSQTPLTQSARARSVGLQQAPLVLLRLPVLLERTTFIALLVIVGSAVIPFGRHELLWELVFTTSIYALAALRIVEGWLSGDINVSSFGLFAPLLAVCAFSLLQTVLPTGANVALVSSAKSWVISADPYETKRFAFKVLALILAAQMLWRCTSNQRRLRALAHVVIGVGVVSAVFALVQRMMLDDRSTSGFGAIVSDARMWQFGNRNHFALLLEMTLGLLLGLLAGRGVRRNRLLIYLTMSLLVGAAIVFTNSRGAIVSMLGELFFVAALLTTVRARQAFTDEQRGYGTWLWRLGSSPITRALLLMIIIGVVVGGIVWVGGDALTSRLESVPTELSANDGQTQRKMLRINIWRATGQLIRAYPVSGTGFGGYWIAISGYCDASGEVVPYQAHNDYLELLASGGLIGTLFFGWFAVALIQRARARLKSADRFRRALCFGALAGIFAAAIHSAFDFGLHNNVNALIFTTLVILATANIGIEETAEPSRLRL